MTTTFKPIRFVLIATAMFLLLTAGWVGLVRMGWQLEAFRPTLPGVHGPLMVSGFLGTLIGLERAVGLHNQGWAYAAPVLTGLGALGLVFGLPEVPSAFSIVLGSAVLVGVFGYIVKHQPLLHSYAMAIAAVAWLVGNLLWLFGVSISVAAAWWGAYLVLTIAGERLELSRLIFLSDFKKGLFLGAAGLYLVGSTVAIFDYTLGWRITGLGMIALAVWLLQNDIARRTVLQEGLTRFIAVCMLSGYVWLGIGGVLAVYKGFLTGGWYDAVLHSVFLGFVFSMIYGHAPIIFPAVLNVPIPYRPAFYAHLVLLHVSMVLRAGAGVLDWHPGRLWGAMLNGIALLLFIGNTVYSAASARRAGVR
ncbi:MAG: hypothetical protein K0R39_3446 [Symbiobacteriaceae bacterium]|jgi:hypothetical protein|nr:hypothetical protein [Symbiobacteriaceae bacterium]